jgi:hypothetical protein
VTSTTGMAEVTPPPPVGLRCLWLHRAVGGASDVHHGHGGGYPAAWVALVLESGWQLARFEVVFGCAAQGSFIC